MTGFLIKKQFREIFRNYFYDAKRNRARSKGSVVAYFIFFLVLMVGFLGGVFTLMSIGLCAAMSSMGLGWLYFTLMGGISVALGSFGSVFSTYSSLYLAKDNDLLLSLPIPVRSIMVSRLMTVYLMGLMYSSVVFVPALAVYWVIIGPSAAAVLGGLLMLFDISLIDLVISCLLGYLLARISLKLKNKGIITALIAVVFFGAYYYIAFRSGSLIGTLIENAQQYAERIKGSAMALYLFGRMGEGDPLGILVWTLGCLAAAALTWFILQRSFLKIATSTAAVKKAVYREKPARQKSPSRAFLFKEIKRLTSNANYMLNCALGVILLPLAGIVLLWKGGGLISVISDIFSPESAVMIMCLIICLAGTMIDTVAPSVSLEGKSLWIARSLPVSPWQALRAKLHLQLILGGAATLFAAVCAAISVALHTDIAPAGIVLFILLPLIFQVFMSCWGLFWGVRMANLNWTNEIYPIKQSMPVFLALFGGWGFVIAMGGIYFLLHLFLGLEICLLIIAVILAAAVAAMFMWLRGKGAARFAEL